jgi:hypothetical protein
MSDTTYHIYAKDKVLYHNLNQEDFEEKWELLNVMVGLLKTDYTSNDLSFIELESKVGYGGPGKCVSWNEPDGEDSY